MQQARARRASEVKEMQTGDTVHLIDSASQSPGIDIDPTATLPPFRWEEVFANDHPIEVEIGCGKGMFLKEAAAANPQVNYLGVERALRFHRICRERLTRARLPNVRLLHADGLDLLNRWIPPRSVQTVHVYFPDPWPKKRHQKRRLFSPAFLDLVAQALTPRGELRLATDDEAYADVIRALLSADAQRFAPLDWAASAADRFPTNYALKWNRLGRHLWWARYELHGA